MVSFFGVAPSLRTGVALTVAYGFVAVRGLGGELGPGDLTAAIGAFAAVTALRRESRKIARMTTTATTPRTKTPSTRAPGTTAAAPSAQLAATASWHSSASRWHCSRGVAAAHEQIEQEGGKAGRVLGLRVRRRRPRRSASVLKLTSNPAREPSASNT